MCVVDVVVVVVVVVFGILLVSLSTCWLGRTVSQLIQHTIQHDVQQFKKAK